MSPRFQADADFNQKIVVGLRRREPTLDIRDAHVGGVISVSDLEVLRIAAEGGRVLLSHDRRTMPRHLADFLQNNTSPGVIIVSQDLDIGAAIEDILIIWAGSHSEEWQNQLGFVPLQLSLLLHPRPGDFQREIAGTYREEWRSRVNQPSSTQIAVQFYNPAVQPPGRP